MPPIKKMCEHLEPFRDIVYYCNECRCGYCRENCPVYTQIPKESLHARGRMQIALALLDNLLGISDGLAENLSLCTTCGWCTERCPQNSVYEFTEVKKLRIDIPKITEAFRTEVVKAHGALVPAHRDAAASIQKDLNPLNEPKEKRLAWLQEGVKLPEKADVVYFAGCMSSYRTQETALSTVKILKAAEMNFTILKDERCCGSFLLRTGQTEGVKALLEDFTKKIERMGASRVVTACAGCYRTFKLDYPKFVGKPDFEILHVSEMINELIKSNAIRLKGSRKDITYHDPCHLGRHAKVYDQPREALLSIPGTKILELPHNRRLAKCCGAGGGFRTAWRDIALQIARNRINEAKEIGVDTLVTACPFCTYNLADAKDKAVQIYDLPVFIAKHLAQSNNLNAFSGKR